MMGSLPGHLEVDAAAATAQTAHDAIDIVRKLLPEHTLARLDALISHPELQRGQLLFWHGLPGTGKTHGLRALASEWHAWCDIELMVDPDVFFGHKPKYMPTRCCRRARLVLR